MAIWKSDEAVETGFAGIRKLVGTVDSIDDTVEIPTTKPDKPYRQACEFKLVDVEILESDTPVTLKENEFSFRVPLSNVKESFWIKGFLASAEALGLDLPDGIIGKRIVFERITMEIGKFKASNFVPVEVSGQLSAYDKAVQLVNGKTTEQVKGIAILDPDVAADSALKMEIQSGAFLSKLVDEGKAIEVDGVWSIVG